MNLKQKSKLSKNKQKKQNEAVRQGYDDPRPKAPVQKIPSMGQQPKLSVVQGGKEETPKSSWIKEVRETSIKKTESAGGIPATAGSNTGLQALRKEADDIYSKWDKKGQFEEFLSKKMPNLSKAKIKALSKAFAFKENKEKEDSLGSI